MAVVGFLLADNASRIGELGTSHVREDTMGVRLTWRRSTRPWTTLVRNPVSGAEAWTSPIGQAIN